MSHLIAIRRAAKGTAAGLVLAAAMAGCGGGEAPSCDPGEPNAVSTYYDGSDDLYSALGGPLQADGILTIHLLPRYTVSPYTTLFQSTVNEDEVLEIPGISIADVDDEGKAMKVVLAVDQGTLSLGSVDGLDRRPPRARLGAGNEARRDARSDRRQGHGGDRLSRHRRPEFRSPLRHGPRPL